MTSNEQIITNARNRWKCGMDKENLVCEVRSLLGEIEIYRGLITVIRRALDDTTSNLRMKGGE